MEKLDLKKQFKHLYKPTAREVTFVEVPEFKFAMLDGVIPAGVPPDQAPEFGDALTALYGIAYTIKFQSKLRKQNPIDFTVMALEALWSVESGQFEFGAKVPWLFSAMIMQPDHVTEAMFQQARDELAAKKPNLTLSKLHYGRFHEGPSIQIMHVGPYSEEPRSIERMDRYAEQHGYALHGRHHEIYLGDPRRAKPENLKTVLRHPVSVRPKPPG